MFLSLIFLAPNVKATCILLPFILSLLSFFSPFLQISTKRYHHPKYCTPVSLLSLVTFLALPLGRPHPHIWAEPVSLGISLDTLPCLASGSLPGVCLSGGQRLRQVSIKCDMGMEQARNYEILDSWYMSPKPYFLSNNFLKTKYNIALKSCCRMDYFPMLFFYMI